MGESRKVVAERRCLIHIAGNEHSVVIHEAPLVEQEQLVDGIDVAVNVDGTAPVVLHAVRSAVLRWDEANIEDVDLKHGTEFNYSIADLLDGHALPPEPRELPNEDVAQAMEGDVHGLRGVELVRECEKAAQFDREMVNNVDAGRESGRRVRLGDHRWPLHRQFTVGK